MNTKSKEIIQWCDEYHNGARYGLEGKILIEEQSNFQKITIFESIKYGRALLLNNCWMTAERQDKHYHESLVHPALCGSKRIDKILIIGGGDGGSARECLKYKEVKSIDLIEIDAKVIEISQKYLTSILEDGWTDSRLNIQIKNGIDWVKTKKNDFYDVIIVDGADPVGPAKELFSDSFLNNCKRILKPGGIFATQSESPEAFHEAHINIINLLRQIFDFADPLYGSVPIYPSGWWSWTFASMKEANYLNPIESRIIEISNDCHIWSKKWQKGAFNAMPAYIERELIK